MRNNAQVHGLGGLRIGVEHFPFKVSAVRHAAALKCAALPNTSLAQRSAQSCSQIRRSPRPETAPAHHQEALAGARTTLAHSAPRRLGLPVSALRRGPVPAQSGHADTARRAWSATRYLSSGACSDTVPCVLSRLAVPRHTVSKTSHLAHAHTLTAPLRNLGS